MATFGTLCVNTITSILYMQALLEAPLSLALPLLKLTPVFLLVTAPIITGEVPSIVGLIGVILSVAGSYMLNLSKKREGFWEPLLSIWKVKGTRKMLIVSMLWSISAPCDKIAVLNSSPMEFLVVINGLLSLTLFLLAQRFGMSFKESSIRQILVLAPIGIFSSLSLMFQMTALQLAQVTYVITTKRLSAVFGMIWGKIFFKETGLRERLIGTIFLLVGMVLILFS